MVPGKREGDLAGTTLATHVQANPDRQSEDDDRSDQRQAVVLVEPSGRDGQSIEHDPEEGGAESADHQDREGAEHRGAEFGLEAPGQDRQQAHQAHRSPSATTVPTYGPNPNERTSRIVGTDRNEDIPDLIAGRFADLDQDEEEAGEQSTDDARR